MTSEMQRLYRSRADRKLLGVCAGLGFYFGIDPVLIRLLWIFVTLATGLCPGVVAYLVAGFIIPKEPAPPAPVAERVPAV